MANTMGFRQSVESSEQLTVGVIKGRPTQQTSCGYTAMLASVVSNITLTIEFMQCQQIAIISPHLQSVTDLQDGLELPEVLVDANHPQQLEEFLSNIWIL